MSASFANHPNPRNQATPQPTLPSLPTPAPQLAIAGAIAPLLCFPIREAGHQLGDAPESEEIPEVTDLDELQTFVGNKHNNLWIWTAVLFQIR